MKEEILKKLFELTREAYINNEFPVAAIIYDDNGIISWARNSRNESKKTIDHAEIKAIIEANKKLNEWRLTNKCMLVSLEPCDMCKTVIKEARLRKCEYLVERYKFKKQYKRTECKKVDINNYENINDYQEYVKQIKTFFNDKN